MKQFIHYRVRPRLSLLVASVEQLVLKLKIITISMCLMLCLCVVRLSLVRLQ